VSEALYLRDPDDNGVELYWDRPAKSGRERPMVQWKCSRARSISIACSPKLEREAISSVEAAIPKYPNVQTNSMSIKVRAAGAVMGALIGDALAVGPHWYYDLDELRRDYGDWITGYPDPKPHRYHAGLKAGQLSQAGIIITMLLRSVVDKAAGMRRRSFAAA
jgi:hypothetical protein